MEEETSEWKSGLIKFETLQHVVIYIPQSHVVFVWFIILESNFNVK